MPWEPSNRDLTATDREVYAWQLDVADFGEAGQKRLKQASVLVTRCGGVGGVVAQQLAAAGVGRLILAHAGDLKPSDLNRQLLMTHAWIGKPRVECAAGRLREFNPRIEVLAVPENVSPDNADGLIAEADMVVDCAPLFEERYALNRAAFRHGIPMIECAMHETEAHLTTFQPGQTGCLNCLYPENPQTWKRRFPVFGAVSGTVGAMAAMEAIKGLAGFGQTLANRLLSFDLRTMDFRTYRIAKDPQCPVCGRVAPSTGTRLYT